MSAASASAVASLSRQYTSVSTYFNCLSSEEEEGGGSGLSPSWASSEDGESERRTRLAALSSDSLEDSGCRIGSESTVLESPALLRSDFLGTSSVEMADPGGWIRELPCASTLTKQSGS